MQLSEFNTMTRREMLAFMTQIQETCVDTNQWSRNVRHLQHRLLISLPKPQQLYASTDSRQNPTGLETEAFSDFLGYGFHNGRDGFTTGISHFGSSSELPKRHSCCRYARREAGWNGRRTTTRILPR
ncbi:hypothetical protein ACLKA6_004511 [Drosophila palustris]